MEPIRVLLVDDHRMVLEGLRVLLEPLEYIDVVGSAATAAEAFAVATATRPHVVLLDINLPDLNGIDVCQRLVAEQPAIKIIALTTLNERSYLTRMLQAGAVGYVLKNALPEELAEAITKVYAGKKFFSDEVQDLLLLPDPATAPEAAAPILTRREKEVLAFIADGLTSQEMADRLFLSPLTIETHRRNLLTKFDANNTATLIKAAARLALI
ncbi:response regulator transcription factor [Hymenobacter sp. ASUV-10]|uniref:Response regulator transcription factor n=1 Tax=Hymenobacter aranciens TaxID=3063996 RepID=A0ABT9BIN2_9BACT|nr:response regulator transcription factor [Hymenobacter sp. ASUV-10]MDO7876373.1 response regulator transcription factor [Hymenobacter sp. ASUV-10]